MKDHFVINRKTWRCGTAGEYKAGKGPTLLLNEKGYMCCLGQVCKQLGVPNKVLIDECEPSSIAAIWDIPYLIRTTTNTALSTKAIEINDMEGTTREKKEEQLIKLFAKYKLGLSFKGKYSD